MKKLMVCLLLFVLMLVFVPTAGADVIWEPVGNQFYDRHASECVYHNRSYYLNGAEGYLLALDQPEGQAVAAIPNGTLLLVHFVYPQGAAQWGLVEFRQDGDGVYRNQYGADSQTAWLPLAELVLQYDSAAFYQEFEAEFAAYQGDYSELQNRQPILYYAWPGAESYQEINEEFWPSAEFDAVYRDAAGRAWGHIGYAYGLRDCWVCLEDPTSAAYAGELVREATGLIPAALPEQLPSVGTPLWLVISLVVLVVAVTAVLIPILMRKRKQAA